MAGAKKPILIFVVCIPLLLVAFFYVPKWVKSMESAELPAAAPASAPMRETLAVTDMMDDSTPAERPARAARPEPAAPAAPPAAPRPARRPKPAPVAKAPEAPPAEPVKQELALKVSDRPAAPSPAAPSPAALASAAATPVAPAPSTPAPAPAPIPPSEPAAAAAETRPPATAAGPPVRVEFVGLCDDIGEVLRSVRLQVANAAPLPVQRLTMTFTYADQSGRKLKQWTTAHEDTKPLADKQTTNEFKCPAFFMPDATKTVGVTLRAVKFTNGSEWKSGP